MFWKLAQYEWKTHAVLGREWLYFLVFLLMLLTVFAIAFGGEAQIISQFAMPVLWVGLLLSVMLMGASGGTQAREQGVVEQLAMRPMLVEIWLLAKWSVAWLISSVALICLLPLLEIMLKLSVLEVGRIGLLLFGNWCLILLCAFAAIIANLSHAGRFIMPLLILPLTVPIIIFGSGSSMAGDMASGNVLALFAGLSLVLTPLCIWGGGQALRSSP